MDGPLLVLGRVDRPLVVGPFLVGPFVVRPLLVRSFVVGALLEQRRLGRQQLDRALLVGPVLVGRELAGVVSTGVGVPGGGAVASPAGTLGATPRATPRRAPAVWLLMAAVAAVALGLHTGVVAGLPGQTTLASTLPPLLLLAVFVAAFALAEAAVVHVPSGRSAITFTLSEMPVVAALFFLPPHLYVAARVAGAAIPLARRGRRSPRKLAFNLALYWLQACVAVACWHALVPGGTTLSLWAGLVAVAVVLAVDVLDASLVTTVIAVDGGTRPRPLAMLRAADPGAAVLNASVALVVVYLATVDWRAVGSVVVVGAVLLFAQRSHHELRRRTEAVDRLGRFTGVMGGILELDTAVQTAAAWIGEALSADVVEVSLAPALAGRDRTWLARYEGGTAEVGGPGAVTHLHPWLADRPLLAPRDGRDRALASALAAAGLVDAVAVRLHGDAGVLGTLLVGNRLGDVETFGAGDVQQLVTLGNHLSVTLRNARRGELMREQADEQVRRSRHDDLTGLPNRRHVEERLAEHRAAGRPAVAILVDLDRFKEINDTLGHATGDLLLCQVAERLRRRAPTDALVARLGGDEFAVLLARRDDGTTDSVVELVREALAAPFELDQLRVTLGTNVGVADSSADANATDVLRRADIAMYAAKERRTGVERYRPELVVVSPARLTLLTELKDAIGDGQLTVAVQPKVSLRDGVVLGAEALVRWVHPERGVIGPDEFVPVAEHSGLITPLTYSVLRQSLAACESWRRAGWDVGVAVNISPRSLSEPRFVDEVARALAAVEVPAAAVTLELTESSVMADPESALGALARLRALGVHLSVDDLGTGYSSLAYLQRLPVSEVKIDRSFVAPGNRTADSMAIVAAIVDLGHRLGRSVVCEGVEDEATWRDLQRLGCDSAQGYWMARPMPSSSCRSSTSGTPSGSHRCARSPEARAPRHDLGPAPRAGYRAVEPVGDTGIEPVTSSVSGKRAPAAPIALLRGGDGI